MDIRDKMHLRDEVKANPDRRAQLLKDRKFRTHLKMVADPFLELLKLYCKHEPLTCDWEIKTDLTEEEEVNLYQYSRIDMQGGVDRKSFLVFVPQVHGDQDCLWNDHPAPLQTIHEEGDLSLHAVSFIRDRFEGFKIGHFEGIIGEDYEVGQLLRRAGKHLEIVSTIKQLTEFTAIVWTVREKLKRRFNLGFNSGVFDKAVKALELANAELEEHLVATYWQNIYNFFTDGIDSYADVIITLTAVADSIEEALMIGDKLVAGKVKGKTNLEMLANTNEGIWASWRGAGLYPVDVVRPDADPDDLIDPRFFHHLNHYLPKKRGREPDRLGEYHGGCPMAKTDVIQEWGEFFWEQVKLCLERRRNT